MLNLETQSSILNSLAAGLSTPGFLRKMAANWQQDYLDYLRCLSRLQLWSAKVFHINLCQNCRGRHVYSLLPSSIRTLCSSPSIMLTTCLCRIPSLRAPSISVMFYTGTVCCIAAEEWGFAGATRCVASALASNSQLPHERLHTA